MATNSAKTDGKTSDAQVAALEAALNGDSLVTGRRPGPRCSFASIIEALPNATAEKIQAAADDEGTSSSALADLLISAGFDITAGSVARHRRRGLANGCRCAR
jgi:hypothetical protein